MTATATRPPKRESIAVLATVLQDKEASTPFNELWWARSDSRVNLMLAVRYDVAAKVWTCDEEHCPGFRHHRHCHHCDRCARMRRINFYSALWAGQPPAVLRRHLAHYQERVASSNADDDDWAACDFLEMRLENQRAA